MNELFCVIDVQNGNEKEWVVYIPKENLKQNLLKLKKIADLYLEDFEVMV